MSRFVRASKYRHVFGNNAKKEYGFENVKVTNSAWDTNLVSASANYLSINWNSSGGGAFAILPLPSPFHGLNGFQHKLPDSLPLARGHTATVLDTDWSPHNDSMVASAAEDGKVMIWKVESSMFEGWGQEGWSPTDFDPVLRIDASARKIGQVLFNPTASNVLASASGDSLVKLWDFESPEDARVTLTGHGDNVQSMAWNPTGTLLATTCRDRKLRIFDPRAGAEAVRINDGHSGIKGSRVTWMGEHDRIATTGFSKMSERQASIWETAGLSNVKTISLDQSAGVVMPFWSDNNILFLAGKGDGNIRYYEYESDSLFALSEYKSSDPQRGMCFLPRRALSVNECEIARAYKVYGSTIEPIAFIVPRKADSFQSDIYPDAPSSEPSLSASEFFHGKNAPANYINLADGSAASGPRPSAAQSSMATPTTAQPSRSFSASVPSPAPAPVTPSASSYAPAVTQEPGPATPRFERSDSTGFSAPSRSQTINTAEVDSLKQENAKLNSELREAREKIRNLELQVESIRANARKAAQALLDAA